MTNPLTGYPEGYLIYLVKQLELGIRRPLDDLLGRHGISMAGYTALTVLRDRPGITSSELARRSFVRAQTMAETVTALTEADLVQRENDPAHRRQILLSITGLGLERVEGLAPDVMRLELEVMDGLVDGQPAELIRALRVCRDAITLMNREDRSPAPAGSF
jgi:DNA-binding MarR family transcriptional regulator